jgi:hypothetical protein
MKKMLSIVLALILCLSAVSAFAEATPSASNGLVFIPPIVVDMTNSGDVANARLAAYVDQLFNVRAAASLSEYFASMEVSESANLEEFAILAPGAEYALTKEGDVEVTVLNPANPFSEDKTYTFLLGITSDEGFLVWTALETKVEGTALVVMFPQALCAEIENHATYCAIVSE